jgi:hypothetical protein
MDKVVTRLKHSSKLLASVGIVCAAMIGSNSASAVQDKVNPHGAQVKAFLERANDYVELQKKAADGVPKQSTTDDPSKLEAYQAALSARMKLLRPAAKPGDIFGEATAMFRSIIRTDAAERTRKEARNAAKDVPKRKPLRVNETYPETAPVATVPPLLLGELPPLPDGLEYRLMGDDLILRDTKANLVADFIHGAAAPITEK